MKSEKSKYIAEIIDETKTVKYIEIETKILFSKNELRFKKRTLCILH